MSTSDLLHCRKALETNAYDATTPARTATASHLRKPKLPRRCRECVHEVDSIVRRQAVCEATHPDLLRYHLGSHHRVGGGPQVWLAVNSRPDWCLVCDDRYSMSVRFSSAGVARVGRARFRVWPPPLRERPRWEGHLHSSWIGRSNGTTAVFTPAHACVGLTYPPAPSGLRRPCRTNSNFHWQFHWQYYPETDNRRTEDVIRVIPVW